MYVSKDVEEAPASPQDAETDQRIMFRVMALYGLSRKSVSMPLSTTEAIDSGQVCITLDPEADDSMNFGAIDYPRRSLVVRYGAQMVFPGLYELISQKRYDPSLLHPVRATATDRCTLSEDLQGFRALGCLEFLPGSIWAGASGG